MLFKRWSFAKHLQYLYNTNIGNCSNNSSDLADSGLPYLKADVYCELLLKKTEFLNTLSLSTLSTLLLLLLLLLIQFLLLCLCSPVLATTTQQSVNHLVELNLTVFYLMICRWWWWCLREHYSFWLIVPICDVDLWPIDDPVIAITPEEEKKHIFGPKNSSKIILINDESSSKLTLQMCESPAGQTLHLALSLQCCGWIIKSKMKLFGRHICINSVSSSIFHCCCLSGPNWRHLHSSILWCFRP